MSDWDGIQHTSSSDTPHHQDVHDVLQAFTLYLSAASGWKMVWKLQQACRQDIRISEQQAGSNIIDSQSSLVFEASG